MLKGMQKYNIFTAILCLFVLGNFEMRITVIFVPKGAEAIR